MPTDIWPTENIIINQNQPACARLRKRTSNRPANRSAADNNHGGIKELCSSSIASAPMHPVGICTLDRASNNRTCPKVAINQKGLWRASRSEAL